MENKIKNVFNKQNIFICIAFAFFLFMMCYNITHSALWGDEWTEYDFSQAQIRNGDLYYTIIRTFQPPLYNFVMHFWLKISQTVLWFRLFNIVPGCISGIFMFITLKKLFNEKIAGLAICVLAVCYQWIYCIQECSEYALMLCCLFGALYYYIAVFDKFSYWHMIMFIFCAVLAIYSQYGAVFVALPLLLLFFVGNIFNRDIEKKRKIVIILSYVVCLVVFAAPLYFFFLKVQLAKNQISSHTIELTADLLKNFPFVLGNILGYFYNLNSGDTWNILFSVLGLVLIIISIFIVVERKLSWNKKSLIISLWIGYSVHYFLVQLHIYAMVHPNQSSGFWGRYSYFYIPILSVVLPIIVVEFNSFIKEECTGRLYKYFAGVPFVICVCLSFFSTLENWNKTFDDQFASIWMENDGWKDTTYLFGMAPFGFNYYVSHSVGYEEGYLDNATAYNAATYVDTNNLSLHFWAWRTNWEGDGWQTTIDAATDLGYTITVYKDAGYSGQLAYCSYDQETNNLLADDIVLGIGDTKYADDGSLHVQISFRNPEDSTTKYNRNDYELSYHILDSEGNIIQWDNDRNQINKWVNYSSQEMIIDTTQILQSDYVILFDVVQEHNEWLSDRGNSCPSLVVHDGEIIEQRQD